MQAGISTACFYPQNTEDALRKIACGGPQCVEIFVNCLEEIRQPLLGEMRAIVRGGGVSVTAIHPYTSGMEPLFFFTKYRRRQEEGKEFYKRYYEAANYLGAGIVVFHGGVYGFSMEDEEYFARYRDLWEDARSAGISLCHENVVRCRGRSPEFFHRLSKAIPDAGFVFDVKQAVRSGEDVYAFAQAMGQGLRHIHISDHGEQGDCLVPGSGDLNIQKLLMIAKKNGFDGTVIVELYRENFRDFVELWQGYQHLSSELSTSAQFD